MGIVAEFWQKALPALHINIYLIREL